MRNFASASLVFDKIWLDLIWQHPKWLAVRNYFFKESLKLTSPGYWNTTFNHALKNIEKSLGFKHKDYSLDMIRQILFSSVGNFSAFIPAEDETALPLETLAQAFNTHYGTHNLPVIMHAWQSDQTGMTKYLSISQNTVTTYDIKSYRPLLYLSEIKEYLPQYLENMQDHMLTRETIYSEMYKRLNVTFYSEKGVASEEILRASELQRDPRIIRAYKPYHVKPEQTFPERSPFLKAFVGFTFN